MTYSFYKIKEEIEAFLNKQENDIFKYGMGSYSLPFRGNIFLTNEIKQIHKKLLDGQNVKVLLLGSNPNSPESISNIRNKIIKRGNIKVKVIIAPHPSSLRFNSKDEFINNLSELIQASIIFFKELKNQNYKKYC